MSNDLSLYIYLQNELEKTLSQMSVIENKSGNELSSEEGQRYPQLKFRKQWLVLQIERLKNGDY